MRTCNISSWVPTYVQEAKTAYNGAPPAQVRSSMYALTARSITQVLRTGTRGELQQRNPAPLSVYLSARLSVSSCPGPAVDFQAGLPDFSSYKVQRLGTLYPMTTNYAERP
jgi:hypothetical protein